MQEQETITQDGTTQVKAPMKNKGGRPKGFKPQPKVAPVEQKAEPKTLDSLEELDKKVTATKQEVDRFQREREKDAEIVEGIFSWHEVKGGIFEFVFRKYKGEPIVKYSLTDGQRYKLPRAVARHLNTNGWTPIYKYVEDANGKPVTKIVGKEQRFSFQGLDFFDDTVMENKAKELVIVSKI
jgi:hypothetical protein